MPLRTIHYLPILPLLALPLGGCATPHSSFGDVAVYSPAVRGYLVDADPHRETSTEPVPALVLVDPISSDKLRCREDVERLKAVLGRAKAADVKQRNAETAMVAWPLTYALGLPAQAAELTYSVTVLPYALVAPRAARGLYHDGLDAFRAADYRHASELFELALLRRELPSIVEEDFRGDLAQRTRTLYYLGLAHEQLRENDQAVLALSRFTRHALRRDAEAYDVAEQRLEHLGSPLPRCVSTEPVAMVWPR